MYLLTHTSTFFLRFHNYKRKVDYIDELIRMGKILKGFISVDSPVEELTKTNKKIISLNDTSTKQCLIEDKRESESNRINSLSTK